MLLYKKKIHLLNKKNKIIYTVKIPVTNHHNSYRDLCDLDSNFYGL